jgi:predicted RND superfamily exporter protein
MAEKLDPQKELTSWEEISYSNMIQQEALLTLLIEKGVITREEYMDRVRLVHKEIQEKGGR